MKIRYMIAVLYIVNVQCMSAMFLTNQRINMFKYISLARILCIKNDEKLYPQNQISSSVQRSIDTLHKRRDDLQQKLLILKSTNDSGGLGEELAKYNKTVGLSQLESLEFSLNHVDEVIATLNTKKLKNENDQLWQSSLIAKAVELPADRNEKKIDYVHKNHKKFVKKLIDISVTVVGVGVASTAFFGVVIAYSNFLLYVPF